MGKEKIENLGFTEVNTYENEEAVSKTYFFTFYNTEETSAL